MIYLEKDGIQLYFGGSLILSSLEAEPLSYGEDFGGRPVWERTPMPRGVRIEGYISPHTEEGEDLRMDVKRLRRMLSWIVSPAGDFTLNVDGIRGILKKGKLSIPRKAPFSGECAEQFIIEAELCDGYFHGETVRLSPMEGTAGSVRPLSVPCELGSLDGVSSITVNNRGDIPVGFEAVIQSDANIGSFSLVNVTTGQGIYVPSRTIASGDRLKICTRRDSPEFTLVRGGVEHNFTGRCTEDSELFMLPVGESVLVFGDGATFHGELSFDESFVSF